MNVSTSNRVFIAILLLVTPACFGWGRDGHMIVGQIATDRLTPQAQAAVQSMLGGKSLAEVANWADEIKSDRKFDWAKPLHYVNLPPGETEFKLDRDCPKEGCVVSAIPKYAAILRDDRANPADRIQALKFLIHFMGDIHQPLHAGHAHDKGGNDIKVEFFYDRANLHELWDSLLIRHARKKWSSYAEELSKAITPKQSAKWQKSSDPCKWAAESHRLAVEYAYAIPKDGVLGQEYFDRCIPIVDRRLSIAGVRLAALLNEAFATIKIVPAASAPATAGE